MHRSSSTRTMRADFPLHQCNIAQAFFLLPQGLDALQYFLKKLRIYNRKVGIKVKLKTTGNPM
jgi:hypothetical protein